MLAQAWTRQRLGTSTGSPRSEPRSLLPPTWHMRWNDFTPGATGRVAQPGSQPSPRWLWSLALPWPTPTRSGEHAGARVPWAGPGRHGAHSWAQASSPPPLPGFRSCTTRWCMCWAWCLKTCPRRSSPSPWRRSRRSSGCGHPGTEGLAGCDTLSRQLNTGFLSWPLLGCCDRSW